MPGAVIVLWHCRQRSFRDDSTTFPCGSWQVVQLKQFGPPIWCGPAISCS